MILVAQKSETATTLAGQNVQEITTTMEIDKSLANSITTYIGIGSNLNQPIKQVRQAIAAIEDIPNSQLTAVSGLYRSLPMGPSTQPDYINAAVCLKTQLDALHLLNTLQAIEKKQGRIRDGRKWCARTLDLDLLLYGKLHINDARLTVPHQGISERIFVLQPLFDLNPALMIPDKGPVRHLLKQLQQDLSSSFSPVNQKISEVH